MEFTEESHDSTTKQTMDKDNIEWLRERGVQIDFPSSKDDKRSKEDHSLDRPITIVKIPQNSKLPYEEVTVVINDGTPGDQLITLLKPHFVGTGQESISDVTLEKATSQLLKPSGTSSTPQTDGGDTSSSSILDKTPEVQKSTLLEMFRNEGHVEAFTLTHPCNNNLWKSVAFYLDEGGQLKGLPPNARAASIAAACGYEGVTLAGDVFIARRYKESVIRHVSFKLSEVDSSATWMKQAQDDNYKHGVETGQVSMDPTLTTGGAIDKGLHTSTDPRKAFEWSQDEDTVDISYSLPAEHKGLPKKSLEVSITPAKVLITKKAEGASEKIILFDLNLFDNIRVSDSTWSRSGDVIEVALEKSQETNWTQLEKS